MLLSNPRVLLCKRFLGWYRFKSVGSKQWVPKRLVTVGWVILLLKVTKEYHGGSWLTVRYSANGSPGFVKTWEELPAGEWLDNDEQGTNWYQTDDGVYWHSTDNGFAIWDEEDIDSQENQVDAKTYDDEMDDDDYDDEDDEEFTPKLPSPQIGVGTALIGIVIAFAVIGWTTEFAIPATDENLVMYGENSADFVKENQILIDGLENVQTLNTATIVLAGGMVIVSALSFLRKSPWWGLSAVNLSLVTVLIMATYTAFSAEKEWVEACNPQVVYCYLSIMPSLSDMDAIYPAVLSAVTLLIVVNNSFNSWVTFDPNEDELTDFDFFDDEEDDVWRGKVKTVVLSSMLLLAGFGIFVTYQYVSDVPNNGPEFQINDAVGNISNGSNDVLVIIDVIDRSTMYRTSFLTVEIQINEGKWWSCETEWDDYSSGKCKVEFVNEVFDDYKLTAEERFMISEDGFHLCAGEPDEGCKVAVKMTYAYDEEEDYAGPQVLPILTVNAISE
ncbi:hypothetical protein N9N26_04580 [Candidatus Poseidoniales archaeon]|nr:hypothetical protein [Candidatus Poseidoniales archaeon]